MPYPPWYWHGPEGGHGANLLGREFSGSNPRSVGDDVSYTPPPTLTCEKNHSNTTSLLSGGKSGLRSLVASSSGPQPHTNRGGLGYFLRNLCQSHCHQCWRYHLETSARVRLHSGHTVGARHLVLPRVPTLVFEKRKAGCSLPFSSSAPQPSTSRCTRCLLHPRPVEVRGAAD